MTTTTPTQSDTELVERMARAINPECFDSEVVKTYGDLWALRQQEKQIAMAKTALAIAKPAIERAVLMEAALSVRNLQCRIEDDFDEGYNECSADAEAAIRALIPSKQETK